MAPLSPSPSWACQVLFGGEGVQGSREAWVLVGVVRKAHAVLWVSSLGYGSCVSLLPEIQTQVSLTQSPILSTLCCFTNVLLESNIKTLIFLFCTTQCSKQASWPLSPGDEAE